MKKKLLVLVGLAMLATQAAQAAQGTSVGVDPNSVYLGGGLSNNSLSGFSDATGWQAFGGLDFAKVAPFIFGAEVGYMDSGNFDQTVCVPPAFGGFCVTGSTKAKGLWTTGIARYPINNQLNVFGRLGYDFGDDDGVMAGVGVGYKVTRQVELRGEYVSRQNIDSLQFNVAFYPNAR